MMLQPGSRPVPNCLDYELIRKLGAGAFGQVWHASGPGGLDVALKFIPLDARVFASERRSLEVMRSIRHPNLVSLFGAWHKDNWLILAMELCDRSLQDRLKEALDQNQPGIPVTELLGYVRDAANGLDALNAKQVQHRDVKPANLLLLNSGVKVADFGLAKALEQTVASNSGAGTIAYVAPECFKGKLTQQSDQYSLAVTYYHLRTGCLLFKGDQAQMMYAHLEVEPDLSGLPPAEGAVLARALSKEPGKRWPNCNWFVDELTKAYRESRKKARKEKALFYFNRGFAWLDKKEYNKAIKGFNEAIRLDPNNAPFYYERGIAWSYRGEHEKELSDFSEAIRLDPKFAEAYNSRGLTWSTQKEFDKAIKDFDVAIRLDPKFARAYTSRGFAWLEKKEFDKAIEDFNEGICLDPEKAYAYFNRGCAWLQKADYDKATLDFDRAVQLDPEFWEEAWLYLEWLFSRCSKETLLACEGGEPLRWWRILHADTDDDNSEAASAKKT
jgi:serine/threonine protein kinase